MQARTGSFVNIVPRMDLSDGDPRDIVDSAPHNIEAEQALLGALLFDNRAHEYLAEQLKPDHFYEPFHGRLFAAVMMKVKVGVLAEPIVLMDQFTADPAFKELGGVRYLVDLVDMAPPAATARDFSILVHALSMRRQIMETCDRTRALAKACDPEIEPLDIISDAEQRIAAIGIDGSGPEAWVEASAMVSRAIQNAKERRGAIEFPSGIEDLDRRLGGLHRGEMTILGARPGAGKTVGAQVFARRTAASGMGTVFFSLEMDQDPMGIRLACDLAFNRGATSFFGVTSNPTMEKVNRNELTDEQWRDLSEAEEIMRGWPLLFDTRPGLTVAQMEAAARRQFRKWEKTGIKPGLIIVDHLGKVRPGKDRGASKHAETADISNDLAAMFKRLDVAGLVLCQLNRGVEGRDDKRPVASDLRQAGEIEEDARQVVFLYRPEMYLREPLGDESPAQEAVRVEKLQNAKNKMFWLIEKNSHGPRGQVQTFCEIACSAIRDWEA